jgi:hypothetical protein
MTRTGQCEPKGGKTYKGENPFGVSISNTPTVPCQTSVVRPDKVDGIVCLKGHCSSPPLGTGVRVRKTSGRIRLERHVAWSVELGGKERGAAKESMETEQAGE